MMKKFKVTLNLQAQITYEVTTDTEREAIAVARDRLANNNPTEDPTFMWTLNEELDPPQIEEQNDADD